MFDYIYRWLQNLAFYMILVTAVIHVVPNNSYRKYIRFFCGLILVVILAGPVMKLFEMKEELHEIYRNIQYEETKKAMQEAEEYLKELEAPVFEEGGER